jgi:hypothetical protein
MKTKFLLIEVPADWKCYCPSWKGKKDDCPRCRDYPLRIARVAVKVQGGISRAIATQFDGEVEVFAVDVKP